MISKDFTGGNEVIEKVWVMLLLTVISSKGHYSVLFSLFVSDVFFYLLTFARRQFSVVNTQISVLPSLNSASSSIS